MSIDFDRFCLNFPVKMPCAVVLSVLSGVGGWGWPSSTIIRRMIRVSFVFTNSAQHSALAANAATFFKIVHPITILPLS